MLENIKTPEELLEFMDIINYDSPKNWHLLTPNEVLKKRIGNCFDQVELEREWFKSNNYEIKTYYMMFLLPYNNPYSTHTFLVYKKDNKCYLFEHSNFNNRGIHEYNSLEDLLNTISNIHIKTNKIDHNITDEEIKTLAIYEYPKLEYGLNFEEYIENILNNAIKIR